METNDLVEHPHELAASAAASIAERSGVTDYRIALTLGSGWAKAAELIGETISTIPAHEVPGFHPPALEGHVGTLRTVALHSGGYALVIGARTHLYEGLGVQAVAHSVRTAAALGIKTLVLTNGAGGLNPSWVPGTPVLISDHINLTSATPLEGATFIDLTDLYSKRLRRIARTVDPELDEGVYAQLRGPQYETPAEVRMVGAIGGDIVGMSTALEAIAAREAGVEVLGMSLITNTAAGVTDQPLSHAEVIEAGKLAEPVISVLLANIVDAIVSAPSVTASGVTVSSAEDEGTETTKDNA